MSYKNTIKGGCHCGNVTIEFHTDEDVSDFTPRTCQCTFCRKHDASWISDPDGQAQVRYANRADVSAYRFGTGTSDFIVCKKCGVLTVALCEIEGRTRAVFNIKPMLEHQFYKKPVLTNLDTDSIEERLARRARNWTGKVTIIG
jgi:hypothetical protein